MEGFRVSPSAPRYLTPRPGFAMTIVPDLRKFKNSRYLETISIYRWLLARCWLGAVLLSVSLVGGLFSGPAAAQTPSCTASDTAVTAAVWTTDINNDPKTPQVLAAERQALAGDCAALLDSKDTLLGTGQNKGSLNWDKTRNMRFWNGVILEAPLSPPRRVIGLRLRNKGLTGQIPAALDNLTELTQIVLSRNQLTGSIPALSNLTKLRGIYLEHNQLSGSLPDLSALTSLSTLALTNNKLSGPLPAWLNKLPSLFALFLASNQFSGSIPDLSALTGLEYLILSRNQLSGSIPSTLGNLSKLEYLLLANNPLTGGIPSQLGRLKELEDLSLCGTDLDATATLPLALQVDRLYVWSCVGIEDASATEGAALSFAITHDTYPVRGSSRSFTLPYTTTDGTAVAGSDYTGTSAGSVTIPANTNTKTTTSSATITVATTNDTDDEADETFTVALSVEGAPGRTHVTQDTATGTIRDDDESTPEVSIRGGSAVTEGGNAQFTLTASPAPASPLAVILTVTQSGDYAASGTTGAQTVRIPTGGSVSHTVATVNDGLDEADGSITATLNTGQGYTVSSSQSAATVNVLDNDEAPNSKAAAEQLIQAMIVRHRDVTGNTGALANWQKALKTVRGEAGGFTVAELEERVKSLSGEPQQRWQKVLDIAKQLVAAQQQQQLSPIEEEIQAMIVRHRDVTGNTRALAKWQKALKTVRGEAGGFTLSRLEARVASLSGTPQARWQRVLDAVRVQKLRQAVRENDRSQVQSLLAAGADGNQQDHVEGHSVLHDAVELALDEIVDDLLGAGVDPDLQDVDGWTALHLAAYGGVTALVQALLDAGADVTLEDDAGRTALALAQQLPEGGTTNAEVVALLQAANE